MTSAGSAEVRDPRSGSEVSRDWLEHMLTTYERRRDPTAAVVVDQHEAKAGTKAGENVASELVKIWVKATLTKRKDKEETDNMKKQEEKEINSESSTEHSPTTTTTTTLTTTSTVKEYNLMAKFNVGTELDREYSRYTHSDLNELLIYSDVVDEMNQFQRNLTGGKYPIGVPEFVYGVCSGDDYVLVMQDVSVLGYKTEDKMKGLDHPHLMMATEHMARLHAVTYAYHQAHDFLKHYPSFVPNDNLAEIFTNFSGVIFDGAIQVLDTRPELGHLAEKLKSRRNLLFSRFRELVCVTGKEHRVVCLSHGDAWTNNLMYSHEETTNKEPGQPKDLLLIDWGIVWWRNPILDLHHLVYNCTSLSFRQRHLQEVLHLYHDTFSRATKDLGAPVDGYDYPAFLQEWKRTSVFGFLQSGIFANSIVLSHKAHEAFTKGKPSTGIMNLLLKGVAKIMVPLVIRGWFQRMMVDAVGKKFEVLFEEIRSGENQLLNSTLIDLILEAEENGVLDS